MRFAHKEQRFSASLHSLEWNQRSEAIHFSMVTLAGGHHRVQKGQQIPSASNIGD
jgi:hypothetical protein